MEAGRVDSEVLADSVWFGAIHFGGLVRRTRGMVNEGKAASAAAEEYVTSTTAEGRERAQSWKYLRRCQW